MPRHATSTSYGGLRGNTPVPGRGADPATLRLRLRNALAKRIDMLGKIADDENATPADRLRALETIAKYGLGTSNELSGKDGAPLLAPDERDSRIAAYLSRFDGPVGRG